MAPWSSRDRRRRSVVDCWTSADARFGARARRSDVRVGKLGLAPGDELVEGLVDARIDRGRLVLGEHPLPDLVGPLGRFEGAVLQPLLEGVVVRGRGPVEG